MAVFTIKLTYMNTETANKPTPIRMRLRRAALSSGGRFWEVTAHLFDVFGEWRACVPDLGWWGEPF